MTRGKLLSLQWISGYQLSSTIKTLFKLFSMIGMLTIREARKNILPALLKFLYRMVSSAPIMVWETYSETI